MKFKETALIDTRKEIFNLAKMIPQEIDKIESKNLEILSQFKKRLIDTLHTTPTNRTESKKDIIVAINSAASFPALVTLLKNFIENRDSAGNCFCRSYFFNSWANSRLNKKLQSLINPLVNFVETLQIAELKTLQKTFLKSYPAYDNKNDEFVRIALSNSYVRCSKSKEKQYFTNYEERLDNFMQEVEAQGYKKLPVGEKNLLDLRINQIKLIYECIVDRIISYPSKFKQLKTENVFEKIFSVEVKLERSLNEALEYAFEKINKNGYQGYENRKIMLLTFIGMYLLENKVSDANQAWILNKIILFTESNLKAEDIMRMAKTESHSETEASTGYHLTLS